jgi:septum site-determining protein MinC
VTPTTADVTMPSSGSQVSAIAPFDLKGSLFTLSVMRLRQLDAIAVGDALARKVSQAPSFFRNMPVVVDLELVRDAVATVAEFSELHDVIRASGLVPVGVRNGAPALRAIAVEGGFAELNASAVRGARREAEAEFEAGAEATPAPTERKSAPSVEKVRAEATPAEGAQRVRTLVIQNAVRSGQQIYAEGSDLIALKTVSAGAEVLADGNIQVLGALRGRALAGASGDVEARIICQSLEAELISIAGRYRVFEEIDSGFRGKAVHIFLANDRLVIDTI